MKKLVFVASLSLFCGSAFALPKPLVTCKSIDVTFRHFYKVKVFQFDVTHPGYYGVTIEKTVDFAGNHIETITKEGPGQITAKNFLVEFGEYRNGRFVKSNENIGGQKLGNGFLKGEMNLTDDPEVELFCR